MPTTSAPRGTGRTIGSVTALAGTLDILSAFDDALKATRAPVGTRVGVPIALIVSRRTPA
jgi:hypothetical protein